MKKSRFLAMGLSVLMVGALAGSAFAAPRNRVVNNRQFTQMERIQQGFYSGRLTRPEAYRLSKNQAKINQYKRIAYADGRLSPNEYRKLDRLQDRQNAVIFQQKHDRQNNFHW